MVVGVAIQQSGGRLAFGDIANTGIRVREGYTDLLVHDFTDVPDALSATVVEFTRDGADGWAYRPLLHGFDADPQTFATLLGSARA